MMPAVFDTDVLSYIFNESPRAEVYLQIYNEYDLRVISFATVVEMKLGARARDWGPRRVALLESFLSRFRVFQSTPLLCHQYVDIQLESRRGGNHMSAADTWIAATAMLLKCPLVSNNRKDYAHLRGLMLISQSTNG